MPAFRSIISIVTAEARDDANATLDAMGFGPDTYRAYLSPDGTWPPTHYVSSHGTTTAAEHEAWAGLLNGDLPAISGEWGVGGIIAEEDAIAAYADGNVILDCITHTDPGFDSGSHYAAIIATMGLMTTNPPE